MGKGKNTSRHLSFSTSLFMVNPRQADRLTEKSLRKVTTACEMKVCFTSKYDALVSYFCGICVNTVLPKQTICMFD